MAQHGRRRQPGSSLKQSVAQSEGHGRIAWAMNVSEAAALRAVSSWRFRLAVDMIMGGIVADNEAKNTGAKWRAIFDINRSFGRRVTHWE